MDPQSTPTPTPAQTPPPSLPKGPQFIQPLPDNRKYVESSKNRTTLVYALIGVLGFGVLLFGGLSIYAFSVANKATTTLNQQKQAAADAARADQKKTDERAYEIAAESPFRSYIAPIEYGSFEIKFPKSWSAFVQEHRHGNSQVILIVHPNFVRRQQNIEDLAATRIELIQKKLSEYLKPFDSQKKVKRRDVTIDSIKSVELTGKFETTRPTRIVVVPVRDKVMVFTNEAAQYSREYDEILAQAKIIP
jgi:hypothetical protein